MTLRRLRTGKRIDGVLRPRIFVRTPVASDRMFRRIELCPFVTGLFTVFFAVRD